MSDTTVPTPDPEAIKKNRDFYLNVLAIKKNRDFYLNVLEKNYEVWKDKPVLEQYPEAHKKKAALLLENQRLMQQQDHKESEYTKHYKKMMDLTTLVLKDFLLWDLVNVHPMLGPVALLHSTRFIYKRKPIVVDTLTLDITTDSYPEPFEVNLEMFEQEIASKTRVMDAVFASSLDEEGGIEKLAVQMKDKIFREVTTDIRNNAGTIAKVAKKLNDMDWDDIYVKIMEISGVVYRKTLRGGVNWIITTPKLASKMLQKEVNCEHPSYAGTIGGAWRMYADPLYPRNEMLLGHHKDEGLLDCYFYNPYILAGLSPMVKFDGENGQPGYNIITRYSKALPKDGPKFYARLKSEESKTNEVTVD